MNIIRSALTSPALVADTDARLRLEDTDSGADGKVWEFEATGTTLLIKTLTDLFGAGATGVTFTRSGTTISSINIAGLTATSAVLTTPLLGTPASGNLANCTAFPLAQLSGFAAGVATFLATPSSANLITAVTDETGSGALVFATTPTLVTPILGVATATSLSVPSLLTASGALTITPTAGSNLNIALTTTGDFAVNTSQLYVDTSAAKVIIGGTGISYAPPLLEVHAATDENLYISGHTGGSSSDGVVIGSVNDAVNANKTLELRGSPVVCSNSLHVTGDVGSGIASSNGITNAVNTTLTNAYVVKGGQAATTANTGWIKWYVGTVVSWVPYWSNATP